MRVKIYQINSDRDPERVKFSEWITVSRSI